MDREKAVQLALNMKCNLAYEEKEQLIELLKNGTWIPVREALPEKHKEVLVTIRHEDIATSGIYTAACRGPKEWYFTNGRPIMPPGGEVIAWMPMLEPYEGEVL